jgi:hypothetical protein
MGLLNWKNKGKQASNIHCIVIGEDKKLTHRQTESTGVFVLDADNLLAFDSFPEAMRSFTHRQKNDTSKYLGLTSLLYEPMARPFSFKTMDWINVEHKRDVILDSALSEGCSRAVRNMDLADRFDRMSTILLIAVAGVIGMALLFVIQSGLLDNVFGR